MRLNAMIVIRKFDCDYMIRAGITATRNAICVLVYTPRLQITTALLELLDIFGDKYRTPPAFAIQ